MNTLKMKFIFGCIGVCLMMLFSGVFIIDQRSQALVLQFGQFVKSHTEPGLQFRIPLIQSVLFYDKRVLGYDLPPISVTLGDQKRLVVDTYTRYRISDPLLFYKSIEPATEIGARMRLESVISSMVRNVLGKMTLSQMLSSERSKIMHTIEQEVSRQTLNWGIEIVDVRIIRTELPKENRNAVFARMNAELIRYAKENRAKGDEKAQTLKSEADRKRVILLAEAERDQKILEAKGLAEANQLTTEAYHKNKEFYEIYRYFTLSDEALSNNNELILSTDGIFSEIFKSIARPALQKDHHHSMPSAPVSTQPNASSKP